ncbi:hypothetical protein [Streptomyces brasiliensis]|uniref:hypothetical protein n=1 Tax=Streptomyces brasiliensis TaxID=1954 RepID=UPI003570F956
MESHRRLRADCHPARLGGASEMNWSTPMRIGVPCEPAGETRVAATPATVKQLTQLGYDVVIEARAGTPSTGWWPWPGPTASPCCTRSLSRTNRR